VINPTSQQALAAKTKIAELRKQLLDLSNRNRLLNFKHTVRGARQVRIVDESILGLFEQLQGSGTVELVGLPRPPEEPDDEVKKEFVEALEEALLTDKAYLKAAAKIEAEATDDGEAKLRKAERTLRDRVRKMLQWPSRIDTNLSLNAHAQIFGINPAYDLVGPQWRKRPQRHWQTLLSEEELGRRLRGIVQQADEARQEYGLETLHFAFGFLEWYPRTPDGQAEDPVFSPLVLQPVNIDRKRAGRGSTHVNGRALLVDPEMRAARAHGETYSISGADSENPSVNLTLRVRLQEECQIALPELDGEEPDLEQFFSQLEDAIRDQPNWKLRRFATLTHLSFSRLAMWLDLDPNAVDVLPTHLHPVLADLLGGHDQTQDGTTTPTDARNETGVPVLVTDCDSSQYAAIRSALAGKNLVIQGPPGTGKSQTISNLIAAALHEVKSVLFVAEKMAALEVVHKRLAEVGLAEFLLELHSAKSGKKPVLESIRKRLAVGSQLIPRDHHEAIDERRRTVERLNAYADAVNTEFGRSGWTVHDLVWRNFAYHSRSIPDALQTLDLSEVESLTQDAIGLRTKALGEWHDVKTRYLNEVGAHGGTHPWDWVNANDLHVSERADLVQQVRRVAQLLDNLSEWNGINSVTCQPNPAVSDFISLKDDLVELGPRPEVSYELWALATNRTQTQAISDIIAAAQSLERARLTILNASPRAIDALKESPDLLADLSRELGKFDPRNFSLSGLITTNEALQRQLQCTREPIERISRFLGNQLPPSVGEVEINAFIALVDLAAAAPTALVAHLHRLGEADAVHQVRESLAKLREIRARKKEIQRDLKVPFASLNAEEVRNAGSEFAAGWALSWVFNLSFRSACRLSDRVVRDLPDDKRAAFFSSIAQIQIDELAWCNDPNVALVPRILFRGVETDIEELDKACDWILRVRRDTPVSAPVNISIRNMLFNLSEELHVWASEMVNNRISERFALLAETCNSRSRKMSELSKTLRSEKQSLNLIQDLQARLNWRGQLSRSRVTELDEAIKAVGCAEETLAAHPDIAGLVTPDPELCVSQINEVRCTVAQVEKILLPAAWISQLCAPDSAGAWNKITKVANELNVLVEDLCNALGRTDEIAFSADSISRARCRQTVRDLVQSFRKCCEFEDFLITRSQLIATESSAGVLGLDEYFSKISPSADLAEIKDQFMWLVIRSMCRRALAAHPVLHSFRHTSPGALRDRFRELDAQLKSRDALAVVAKLLQRTVPTGNSYGLKKTLTERAFLQHVAESGGRCPALREVIRRAGRALQALKPCFLMSPLSVAQLVKRGALEFDLVIFDEASQVRPEDALCALARSRQFVVVGDQMQLPPTSFGEKTVTEADIDDEGDGDSDSESAAVESILETAAAAYSGHKMLLWHYRSQDPALIAFSNQEFYGGELKLFPAPRIQHPASGIKYVWVGGTYSVRTNLDEAKQCAAAAAEFMRQYPERSLGIVALNRPQANLIDNEIERQISDHPHVAAYRAKWSNGLEPLFVKNLENVQGDERDAIFISTVFGTDGDGNFFQRFGPINSKVGHRRLNVLFTRAKYQLVLFTSIPLEKIVVSETSHRGVRALKQYLEFARSGRLQSGRATGRSEDSPFEVSVRAAIESAGYKCEPQVGVSGFFIDLAVRHPKATDDFILGVECDGASYHSSRSARDRDRLRQEILERMGWRIHRVWSTDWFSDPKGQLQRLLAVIEELSSEPPAGKELAHLDYPLRFGKLRVLKSEANDKTVESVDLPVPANSSDTATDWVGLVATESFVVFTKSEMESVSGEHLRGLLQEAFTLPPKGPVIIENSVQRDGWFSEVKMGEYYNREVYLWFEKNKNSHLGRMPWMKNTPLQDNIRFRAQAIREVIARLKKPQP
jgi:very-short-patch-repair endonuclease